MYGLVSEISKLQDKFVKMMMMMMMMMVVVVVVQTDLLTFNP